MAKDIVSLYTELDRLGKATTDAAKNAPDIEKYFEARNNYRDTIIRSEISADKKSPHFITLADNDITFFKRNNKKYPHAAEVVYDASNEYFNALFNVAKISDIKRKVKNDSTNQISHGEMTVAAVTHGLDVKKSYKKTEEIYMKILGISSR